MGQTISTDQQNTSQTARILAGKNGINGERGPQGIQGFPGKDSVLPGPRGIPGENGKDGHDSVTPGPQGIRGEDGKDSVIPGPQGLQGIRGITGGNGKDSMVPGPQGIQGLPGKDSIVPGPQGIPGIRGITGENGKDSVIPGPQGIQGFPGKDSVIPGPQGIQGFPGKDSVIPGPQGIQGFNGKDGINGINGSNGKDSIVPGPQGIQGLNGAGIPQNKLVYFSDSTLGQTPVGIYFSSKSSDSTKADISNSVITNDTAGLKALALFGNTASNNGRQVKIFDDLTVDRGLFVPEISAKNVRATGDLVSGNAVYTNVICDKSNTRCINFNDIVTSNTKYAIKSVNDVYLTGYAATINADQPNNGGNSRPVVDNDWGKFTFVRQ